MDVLIEKYAKKLSLLNQEFRRSLIDEINWKARLIGIKGAKGVGKTTLLLQFAKFRLQGDLNSSLYVSLDDLWFNRNTLVELADAFAKRGGKWLFIDEVHKYGNWSQELKNIYDDYPELKIVFTGSSLLEILNARSDLSRRAVMYHMQGLSFREYISFELGKTFPGFSLKEILTRHTEIVPDLLREVRPLQHFPVYLKSGYYPFYQEVPELYSTRLEEVINMMLEIELPLLRKVDLAYISKIKQLLLIIAESAPFIPNVSNISDRIGINRATLLTYLHYLDEIGLTKNLFKPAGGISKLQKPNKIYLENTNLAYVLGDANIGNARETFFNNQLSYHHEITYPDRGDFLVDEKYLFEIGGKDKDFKQIKNVKNSFVAADDIEYGHSSKIPLWLFGFLY
ncbi:MAG TPA: AAA family ATPase [Cytophagaceae bacterium]